MQLNPFAEKKKVEFKYLTHLVGQNPKPKKASVKKPKAKKPSKKI